CRGRRGQTRQVLPDSPPRWWPAFDRRLRSAAVTARVGRVLGIALGTCFLTGLLSHYQYHPWSWLPEPATPAWGYRLTQGVHVITGIASIPLLLVKLWSVFPLLFQWPPARSLIHAVERLSIAVLISSALVELTTGLLNVLQWYPWAWSFISVHYWLAWVVAGSVLLHLAVKLPVVRRGLAEPVWTEAPPGPGSSRRGVLIAAGAGVGAVALTTVGQVLPSLEPIAVLAPRRPRTGPARVPINRTARAAGVTEVGPSYRLSVTGPQPFDLDLAQLEALPAATGALMVGYGVWRILGDAQTTKPLKLGEWLLAAIVLHDGVLAWLVLGVSWLVARVVPPRARTYVQGGLVCAALLTVIALP